MSDTEPSLAMALARYITAHLEAADLPDKHFLVKADVVRSDLSRWRKGDVQRPNVATLEKVGAMRVDKPKHSYLE